MLATIAAELGSCGALLGNAIRHGPVAANGTDEMINGVVAEVDVGSVVGALRVVTDDAAVDVVARRTRERLQLSGRRFVGSGLIPKYGTAQPTIF